jgi:hypothetical protein
MIPRPKFDIGSTVYVAGTQGAYTETECPTCLGTGRWRVALPSGEEFDVACEECSNHGVDRHLTFVPEVCRLTIGSVRMDTHDRENPVSYMCEETGVGAGTIHHERHCFATHEEALEASRGLALASIEGLQERREFDQKNRRGKSRGCSLIGHLRNQRAEHVRQIASLDRHIAKLQLKEPA